MRPAVLVAIGLGLAGCPDPGPPSDTDVPMDLEAHDPLSRPAAPTLDPADFETSTQCAACHPDHAAQWSTSQHAHAITDTVFQALSGVRVADHDGRQTQFCTQCHSAIGARGGEFGPGFSFADLSPVVQEGVTCVACHRISELVRENNAGHVLDPNGPMRGPLADPSPNDVHTSEVSALFGQSELCGSCHDVIETSDLPLERAYAEWTESPAAADGRSCQDCHMPTRAGKAAVQGPDRPVVHDHRFIGVDVPLQDGVVDEATLAELRAASTALLQSSATVSLDVRPGAAPGGELDLDVTVVNQVDGHALPTGSTFNRQLWIELVVTDAHGDRVYASGDLDAQGDLRNRWSALDPYGDADLVTIGSGFVDAAGEPTLFPWLAADHSSTAIPAGLERTYRYFVPVPAQAAAPLHATARLRFRPLGPFLLRALSLDELVPRLEIVDIDAASADVDWEAP